MARWAAAGLLSASALWAVLPLATSTEPYEQAARRELRTASNYPLPKDWFVLAFVILIPKFG